MFVMLLIVYCKFVCSFQFFSCITSAFTLSLNIFAKFPFTVSLILSFSLCFCESLVLVIFNSPFLPSFLPCFSVLLSVKRKAFGFNKALKKGKEYHGFDKCFKSKPFFSGLWEMIHEAAQPQSHHFF